MGLRKSRGCRDYYRNYEMWLRYRDRVFDEGDRERGKKQPHAYVT